MWHSGFPGDGFGNGRNAGLAVSLFRNSRSAQYVPDASFQRIILRDVRQPGLDAVTGCGKLTFCTPGGCNRVSSPRATRRAVSPASDAVPAALKKADELLSGGFFNVEIVMPDGAAYQHGEFDQLREQVGLAAGR